jgi:uncharacterized membrane protein
MGGGGTWSPMEAVSFGWNALMKNFVGVSLPIAVAAVLAVLPGQIITYTYVLTAALVAEYVDPSFIGILSYLVQATSALVGLFVNSFIMGGIISFALKVVRGQPYAFGDVFSGGKYFGRMLVGTVGLYVAVAIGMILCIVPGYIALLGLSMYSFLIVDQGLPGIDALKKSWAMTQGHKLNIFLFGLIGVGVVIAGFIACGIGVLLGSYPIMILGAAYIYDRLNGGGAGAPAPAMGPAY